MPEADAVLLARAQFAFTIGFHIVLPAFTIGLASYLAVLEALWLATGRQVYRDVFQVLAAGVRRRVRHGRRLRRGAWPTSSAPTGRASPTRPAR